MMKFPNPMLLLIYFLRELASDKDTKKTGAIKYRAGELRSLRKKFNASSKLWRSRRLRYNGKFFKAAHRHNIQVS